jgi:hypothetical protein
MLKALTFPPVSVLKSVAYFSSLSEELKNYAFNRGQKGSLQCAVLVDQINFLLNTLQ